MLPYLVRFTNQVCVNNNRTQQKNFHVRMYPKSLSIKSGLARAEKAWEKEMREWTKHWDYNPRGLHIVTLNLLCSLLKCFFLFCRSGQLANSISFSKCNVEDISFHTETFQHHESITS